jgi:hypothetical protein
VIYNHVSIQENRLLLGLSTKFKPCFFGYIISSDVPDVKKEKEEGHVL